VADAVPAGQTVQLVVLNGPEPNTDIWMSVAIAAVVLIAAALLAYWRGTRAGSGPARRRTRILWTALAGAGGLTLILIPNDLRWGGSGDPFFQLGLLMSFAMRAIVALMLFGTLDLMLDYFRPHRVLLWLGVGLVLLPLFVVGILAASSWLEVMELGRASPIPGIAAVAAALVWWSWLPTTRGGGDERRIAHVFE
jgi:hypothetical protein